MGHIFSGEAAKKCIQMHYIGKSYVTTVYKCDNERKSDDICIQRLHSFSLYNVFVYTCHTFFAASPEIFILQSNAHLVLAWFI